MTTFEDHTQPTLELVERLPPVPKVKPATAAERRRIAGHPSAFTVPFGALRLADNIRAQATDVTGLAAEIRAHGLLAPIAVRPYGDDSDGRPVFVVETGHRRYNALRALKLSADDPVPVHPVTEAAAVERTVRQWVENMRREPLTPIDEARTLRTLTKLHGMRIREAAKLLGVDRNTASRRLHLLRLPETAQQAVADGEWEIEAAQLVGRLIRDSAPAALTDRMIADRATRSRAQSAVDEHTAKRDRDRIRAQLESRGFVVVRDARNGEAPDGHRTEMHRHIGPATLEAIKQLDTAQLDTVRTINGRPIVWLARSSSGELQLYSLRLRELSPPPDTDTESDPADLRLTHRQHKAGRDAMKAERSQRIIEFEAGPKSIADRMLHRLALHTLLSRAHTIDVQAVADAVGVDPVMVAESSTFIGHEQTANAWFEQLDHEQTTRALTLVVLMQQAVAIGYSDGSTDRDPLSPAAAAVLQIDGLGLRAPLPESEFRAVAVHADEQLDHQHDEP